MCDARAGGGAGETGFQGGDLGDKFAFMGAGALISDLRDGGAAHHVCLAVILGAGDGLADASEIGTQAREAFGNGLSAGGSGHTKGAEGNQRRNRRAVFAGERQANDAARCKKSTQARGDSKELREPSALSLGRPAGGAILRA